MAKIDVNSHGTVFIITDDQCVIGLITDGDIRRELLKGASLDEEVLVFANKDFIWAPKTATREALLKQLDSRIRIIPILDDDRRLLSFVSRDEIPVNAEERVSVRARSPVRISFGGGGSDLTHFFSDDRGAVVNATISLYSHAILNIRDDSKIILSSRDLQETITFDDFDALLSYSGKFGLIQSLIKIVHPSFGFELTLYSDYPMNSGLGGSAVVAATVLGCFNQLRRDKWDRYEIAELAFQAERLHLGVSGGWQDQYASVFGGFNFMEFQMEQNIVNPLRIPKDILIELEENLILCDTATTHDSGNIHDDQRQHMKKENVREMVRKNVELTYEIRNHLLKGRLIKFGESLHKAWELKKQMAQKISNGVLDEIYEGARKNGAIGGKLLGAGGGGFFLFYTTAGSYHQLLDWLASRGLTHRPFHFDQEGLQTWTVRRSDVPGNNGKL